ALQVRFPNIDRFVDFMAVERHLGFESQRIARSETAGQDPELPADFEHPIPNAFACDYVRRHINLKSILARVSSARNECVLQSAYIATSKPVILDGTEVSIGQLLEKVRRAGALNRKLREIVAHILGDAIKSTRIFLDPRDVFFTRARIDHQEIVIFS